MNNILLLASIVMLVLLFLKVPVFIAVLGGSMVYFVMNPNINPVIFAQQAIIGTEKISLMAIPFFVCAGIRAAQLASIRQMSGQVSRGSAGEYQANERARVAWLSWRVSGR